MLALKLKKNKAKILSLKLAMNSKRTSFIQADQHKINITPYWVLGIIEAESSFMILKKITKRVFSCTKNSQKAVIEAIYEYFKSLYLLPPHMPVGEQ
jgi:hypothetical protein